MTGSYLSRLFLCWVVPALSGVGCFTPLWPLFLPSHAAGSKSQLLPNRLCWMRRWGLTGCDMQLSQLGVPDGNTGWGCQAVDASVCHVVLLPGADRTHPVPWPRHIHTKTCRSEPPCRQTLAVWPWTCDLTATAHSRAVDRQHWHHLEAC